MKTSRVQVTEEAVEKALIAKADLVTSELNSNGGLLSPTQSTRFLRKLVEAPTIINAVRFITMPADTHKIPKIGIGTRILRAATENTGLTAGQRAKVVTSQISLTAKEVIAEMRLPYVSLEDNIEGQDLITTVLDLIAEQAAVDLEDLALRGDSAFVDGGDADNQAYMRLHDGYLKRITSNVVDAASAGISFQTFTAGFKALAPKYRANRNALQWFITPNDEATYMELLASRQTGLGDAYQTGAAKLRVQGVEVGNAPLMPAGSAILTNPKNLIMGIRRRFTLESEKLISERQIKFVLTARVALQIEEEEACVKVTNLAAS